MEGSIALQCRAGSGTTAGKLHVNAILTGGAKGHGGEAVFPWQVAVWLGLALQNPRKWIPRCPRAKNELRVILNADKQKRLIVTVEVLGRIWFETFVSAEAERADGSKMTIHPAHAYGVAIYTAAKKVEEQLSARDKTGVLSDQAVLFAGGLPQLLTTDPAIIAEAKKRAGLDTEYRRLGTARFQGLNNKPLINLPTARQYAPGMSEFDFQMQRLNDGSMSRKERRVLAARLRQEG